MNICRLKCTPSDGQNPINDLPYLGDLHGIEQCGCESSAGTSAGASTGNGAACPWVICQAVALSNWKLQGMFNPNN